MALGLENKVALVTGGGKNIGRQICLTLAGHGCDVVVNVRTDIAAAQAVAAEIEGLGRRALAVAADIADPEAVNAMVARARDEFGRVDILVNNAGMVAHHTFLETTEAMWHELMGVNLSGPIHTCQAVVPIMLEQGSGSIINITGTVVFYGSWPHLAAAKSGVHGLTRGLAQEFGRHGIRANVIVPSSINTPRAATREPVRAAAELARTALKRLGEPREIADICAFLASDMSSYLTGQTFHANGGQFMP
jgi:3-oxoacyl-[acyl-carrier protein] reductase